ncbi:hypothetical protein Tco_1138706, partial [Tanacetum coccineum]
HQSETKVIHNDDGNPSRANIKQALSRTIYRWTWRYLVPAVTPPNLGSSGILNIRGRYFIDQ